MWTILKNPKNILILVLAVLVLVAGAIVLFQRTTVAKQKATIQMQAGKIEAYGLAEKAYRKALEDYAGQVIKWKKLAENQQTITNNTATVVTKIKYIKSKCALEGDDAKIVNGVFNYFNTGKLLDN